MSMGDEEQSTHIISRNRPTSDNTPPWSGLEFVEPVDSDALAANLKQKYPFLRTLRERKHMAAIEFLTVELHAMQAKDLHSPGVSLGAYDSGIGGTSCRSGSTAASPTTTNTLRSPQLPDRSHSDVPQHVRPGLRASTPTLEEQSFVFTAVDISDFQPKTRRRMTKAERKSYKAARERGACEKCRRLKGRCTHINDATKDDQVMDSAKLVAKRRSSLEFNQSSAFSNKAIKIEESTAGDNASRQPIYRIEQPITNNQLLESPNTAQDSTSQATANRLTNINERWRTEPGSTNQSEEYVSFPVDSIQAQPCGYRNPEWNIPANGIMEHLPLGNPHDTSSIIGDSTMPEDNGLVAAMEGPEDSYYLWNFNG